MKIKIYLLIFSLIFISGTAYPLDIWVDFTGPAVVDYEGSQAIKPGDEFNVNIYAENTVSDPARLGWSSPFHFYGTDLVTTLAGPMEALVDPSFEDVWDMGIFTAVESWDGDLTNFECTGGLVGDQFNFSGISMAGWNPGSGPMLAFTLTGVISIPVPQPDVDYGIFCVAQGDFCNDTYDWLFDLPIPSFETTCLPVKFGYIPIDFTNCPMTDLLLEHDDQFAYDFDVDDPGGGSITFEVLSGPGNIDPETGVFTWSPDCSDVGTNQITVGASHQYGTVSCEFNIIVGNSPPEIGGACGGFSVIATNKSKTIQFTASDPNLGDVLTFYSGGVVTNMGVPFDGVVNVNSNTGEVTIVTGTSEGSYTLTMIVTDCAGATDECTYDIDVASIMVFSVVIDKLEDQLQGHHSYVGVKKMDGGELMHGFDFLIGYDQSALTFIGAMPGEIYDNPGPYEWEYFNYRYSWNGNCGAGCPSGLLRVVGMAEQNDGGNHPNSLDIADGTELFYLDFLVSNDRTLECMYIPVYFYWMDCGDNAIAFQTRADASAGNLTIRTAVSNNIYHFNGDMTADPPGFYEYHDMNVTYGFPTPYGVQSFCLEGSDPGKPVPEQFIDFFNGGVDIICADSIDKRGDVNLNGIANEVADAVTFTNYFIYGIAAFTVNVEGQIAATEINGDGITLSVADLVYLIRIIVGDALPLPKVSPYIAANLTSDGHSISVDNEVGAAFFVLDGNVDVFLGQGAIGMELKKYFNEGRTNVLIYALEKNVVASGELLVTDAEIVKAELSDYSGNLYKTNILPEKFELKQNYPNPFNPVTTVEISLPVASEYNLMVYNVAGQRVFEVNGYGEAGAVNIDIDLSGHSSGVYFYKVAAGQFTANKKMLLLK